MSRNKNKPNKGTNVSDNNDLSGELNSLGNLGSILNAAADTAVKPVTEAAILQPGATQQQTPPHEPVLHFDMLSPESIAAEHMSNIQPPVEQPVVNPVEGLLEAAGLAAAEVVAKTAPVTDFTTPVKVDMARVGDTSRVRIQKAIFDTYVEVTAPGLPVDWVLMSNHHIKMCKALIESAGYPYIEFKEVYDHLLRLVKEHRAKSFSDIYVRRFDDRLYPKMTKDQIAIADRLLSIITTVGRHNDRSRALAQIDLAASLKHVKPALAQQNLSAYFGAFRR